MSAVSIIYDVDSIRFSEFFQITDTVQYQIMELVDSSFTDAGGNKSYRIVRSRRNTTTDPWIITDIWLASRTNKEAVKVEENLHFIKLVFPILLNETWKGNQLIETDSNLAYLAGWNYEYTSTNAPLDINGLHFDSTVTVLQNNYQDATQKLYYEEQYAKNVGLIFKEEDNIQFLSDYPNGFILRMTVNSYH